MKQLLISFLSLVIVLTTPTFGQVDSVTDQYMGNGNLLVNPGLESGLKSWTNVAGTLSIESSVVIKGKRAGKVVLSSQALNLYQDVTSYQAQLADGVQGLASVRIKTSVSGLRLCPRQAGVINSSLCVSVASSNKWGLYKVPFILGATSNGISINSNGTSVSGTVYFDDSFMGPQELSLETNACNDVSCETEFSAKVSITGVISDENYNFLGTCTPSSGLFTCNFESNVFTVSPNCVVATQNTSTLQSDAIVYSTSSTQVLIQSIARGTGAVTSTAYPFNIICQKQGADFTAAKQLSNGNTYSSTNADTDWATCGHTTSSFTGFGTVSAIETQCKREGSDLLIKGKFTSQTGTATELRLSLPSWNGSLLTSAGTSLIPSIQQAGKGNRSTTGTTFFSGITLLIEPSVSYLTFGGESSTLSGTDKATGTAMANIGPYTWMINARVPIQGWQNSNLIIAELNGLQKCASTLDCTDTFSAYITSTATVVSGSENVDFLEGNCTLASTSNYTCSFKSGVFTSAPNCVVSYANASSVYGGRTASIKTVTSSQLTYITEIAGSLNAAAVQIICQKSGADYTGKTAKAVASDQNLRTPGITKSVFYSSELSSAGVVSSEFGDFLSGNCTCSSGNWSCTFVSGVWDAAPNCSVGDSNIRDRPAYNITESTSSLTWRTSDNLNNGFCVPHKVFCHGVSP